MKTMTQNQAIKAMQKRYPGYSVRATVETWKQAHSLIPNTEYSVYAGNETRAHAGGRGATFQEAFDSCTEYSNRGGIGCEK